MTPAGQARHEQLGLSPEQMLRMFELTLMTRRFDERLWLLQRAGKIPFVISPQGAEGAQIGTAFAFRPGQDYYAPYYRDMGINFAAGVTAREIMLAAFAREECPASGGKQMCHHWGHRPLNVLNGSSPVTTQFLHAVGLAQAARMKGHDIVCYTGCGEGSSNQGDFHEALNWAALYKLPVIFLIQNNEYAISVHVDKQIAGGSIAARAAGYGMPGVEVDGSEILAVYQAAKEAHERARTGAGPTLIEAKCARFTSHSSDDDQRRYRPAEELAAMKEQDPLLKLQAYMLAHRLLDKQGLKALEQRIAAEIDDATDYAEGRPVAPPEFALTQVYGE